jgi:hypothetical protein
MSYQRSCRRVGTGIKHETAGSPAMRYSGRGVEAIAGTAHGLDQALKG